MPSVVLPLLLPIVYVAIALYQLYVTNRLIRFTGYTRYQKAGQVLVIWLLPLLGGLIVHSVIKKTERRMRPADRSFIPQDDENAS
jgi:hypothetical protein